MRSSKEKINRKLTLRGYKRGLPDHGRNIILRLVKVLRVRRLLATQAMRRIKCLWKEYLLKIFVYFDKNLAIWKNFPFLGKIFLLLKNDS